MTNLPSILLFINIDVAVFSVVIVLTVWWATKSFKKVRQQKKASAERKRIAKLTDPKEIKKAMKEYEKNYK